MSVYYHTAFASCTVVSSRTTALGYIVCASPFWSGRVRLFSMRVTILVLPDVLMQCHAMLMAHRQSHAMWRDATRCGTLMSSYWVFIITYWSLGNFTETSVEKLTDFIFIFYAVYFISVTLYLRCVSESFYLKNALGLLV